MRFKKRSVADSVLLLLMLSISGLTIHAQVPGQAAAAQSAPAQTAPPAATVPGQAAGSNGGRGFGPAVGVPVLGMPFVHDPSTVVRFKGRYYVFSTGRGAPFYSSPDGETWTREGSVFQQIPDDVHAVIPKNNGTDVWAPDLVRMNGQFYLYYAVSSWGSFQSAVALATNPVLDPKDPAYKWTSRGAVVTSDGVEDLNAIDPGVIHAPDGTLWICYGSYHGSIRVTQLDPQTGLALHPKQLGEPVATARGSEASDIIFHDGYYYLFVNHGSCCKGKASEYNIRVGRSKSITGPYLDKHGDALADSGGSLFLAAHDHRIGPGHFGRLLDYDNSPDGSEGGPERFSVHYEADLTRGGRSVLDIRPLLWSVDGWPVAGDNLTEGTYQIVARQSENTLEAHVPVAQPAPGAAPARVDPSFPAPPPEPIGPPVLHLARYLTLDDQKWTIAPAQPEEATHSASQLAIYPVVSGQGPWSSDQNAMTALGGVVPPGEMLVHGNATPSSPDQVYLLQRNSIVEAKDFSDLQPSTDANGRPNLAFTLTTEAGNRLYSYTSAHSRNSADPGSMAIVLGGKVKEVAAIASPIRDRGMIEDVFSQVEAVNLSSMLHPVAVTMRTAGGFSKIVNAGTGLALGADNSAVKLTAYSGSDEQLWRLEQYPNGGYRIRNKANGLSLMAPGPGGVSIGEFRSDDLHLWTITTP